MSERAFFTPEARTKVAAAVREVEASTAAEVVVAVRRMSGFYRHADYLAGAVTALGVLLVLLFHPQEFYVDLMPFEVVGAFAIGTFAGSQLWSIRRRLAGRQVQSVSVGHAARATFVDAGLTRTSGRTAVLVFVSVFERRAEVVTDIGLETAAMGPAWTDALAKLDAAVAAADLDRFVDALRALGPPLGAVVPRAATDVNELPDEVQV